MLIAEHYEKGEEIGRGGMGVVYLGRDVRDDTPVAIKWLKDDVIASDPAQVERFISEGELLRQMNHPNIVKMLAADQTDGCYYLVLEYVEGGSLLDVMRDSTPISLQRALYIALDIADALTRAHRLNVLHRDIKPANVLIAADGTPLLTDFGMARAKQANNNNTQEGAIVGTLAYLAPEAFAGEQTDERTDIWAFGVMLYEMLAGQRPHDDISPGQLINSIMTQPIKPLDEVRPGLPTALVDLVGRMLERERHARIPSVRMVGAELESIIRGATTSMQYLPAAESTGRFESQNFSPTPTAVDGQRAPNNLPAQPTPFVGRDEELQAIADHLSKNERLVTLLGPGGMGKTRIALAAAEAQLSTFRDGVYFVPLAPLASSDFVTQTVGEQIGYSFNGVDDQRQELINFLREKSMLLVLDNFEHVVDAAGTISAIMRDAPNVKLIVTSRERLRLRGEQILEIDGMRLPDENDPTKRLCDFPSMQLFSQSARRVAPDFELDDENGPHAARIIRLVGGLPLGIELAAAWLEMLPIEEIADEIERSLDFLETDLRDVPERHRSIRAVIDYSWNLMTDDERDVFVKLSVFRGGFEREAAQKVAGASLRTLTTLVNKSLLRRDPNGRYLMHTLLRQFAEDRFTDLPDADAVRDAHAMYYCALVTRLETVFNSRKEQAAVEQLDEEKENLRAAIYWAVTHQMWDEVENIYHTVLLFLIARSMLKEGIDLFGWIADELYKDGMGDTNLYWNIIVHQSWLTARTGSYDAVMKLARPAHDHLEAFGDTLGQVRALNMMSYAQMFQGHMSQSVESARKAAELADSIGANADWFQGMGNMAYAEFLRGNLEEAKRINELLLEVQTRKPYSPIGIAYMYNNLGEIVRELGDFDRAKDLFEKAYEIFAAFKMKRGMAFTINNLGGIAQVRGDVNLAERCYNESYMLNREIGDQRGIGHSLSALGNLASYTGDATKARDYFQQSLEVRQRIGEQRGIADSLSDLAQNAVALEDMETATDYINQAAEIYQMIGDRQGMAYTAAARGMGALMAGHFDEAHTLLTEAQKIGYEIGSAIVISMSGGGLAMIALAQKDYASALELGMPVLERAVMARVTPMVLSSLGALALVKAGKGHPEIALEMLAVVRNHHSIFVQMMRDELDTLYDELVSELPGPAVDEIIARAKTHDLYTFAQGFITPMAEGA